MNKANNGQEIKKPRPLKALAGAPDKPLEIGAFAIPCYVLEDETRVISQRGLYSGLRTTGGGIENTPVDAAQMPRFAQRKWLQPFLPTDLKEALRSPIEFTTPFGQTAYGYPAECLVALCDAILKARDNDAVSTQQDAIVRQADLIIRGLAVVGIIALIDEATGYEKIRVRRTLARILEKYITKALQPWIKTFPLEFYEQICRLKNWSLELAIKRPSVVGKYTNDIVYDRVAPGLRDELCKRNPMLPDGRRQYKHHQWLTPEHGHPELQKHLAGVIALMRTSQNWDAFMRKIRAAYPKPNEQLPLLFADE